jgi:hypothetical protein
MTTEPPPTEVLDEKNSFISFSIIVGQLLNLVHGIKEPLNYVAFLNIIP